MRTIYSDQHRLHVSPGEFGFGEFVPAFEKPERAEIILGRVREVGLGAVEPPKPFPLDHVTARPRSLFGVLLAHRPCRVGRITSSGGRLSHCLGGRRHASGSNGRQRRYEAGALLHRCGNADYRNDLACSALVSKLCADGCRADRQGRAGGIRVVPPAGSSRRNRSLRWLLFSEQCRNCGAISTGLRPAQGRDRRYRLSPRQRHSEYLLFAWRRVLCLDPCRSGFRLPLPARLRRRERRWRGRRGKSQFAAARRNCLEPVVRGARPGARQHSPLRCRCGRRFARSRYLQRRSDLPLPPR